MTSRDPTAGCQPLPAAAGLAEVAPYERFSKHFCCINQRALYSYVLLYG